ncbi:MAG: flagellar motor protein [Chromatiaceae bacterium]|nr:flagellar motor protein [Gammaproteobacteria bacterium]MCP5318675.1 flagellar motor protein [Chromatiaceae bacterium]MCW5586787.1 flagellar motor protein [Chromatiales bacterium]MCP5431605.1 flagellar motor protein [Chromatiaceae bacterium]MCP5435312.1 flagellar motor protein [Chromatiaceae bacterium]
MDLLSFIGVIIAFAAILGGNWLEGGHLDTLANGPAMVIVLGGSIGAVLLQTPLRVFLRTMRMLGMVFVPPKHGLDESIVKLVEWSKIARKEGLLGLEKAVEFEPDLFVRKGMQLLVDGNEPDEIRHTLEVELDSRERFDLQASKVLDAMGGYSPTIGIIGAVMGLIHVMQNLSDPSKLGSGIATAFVATIYGVGLANLFLLPMANKLKAYVLQESHYRELVIEGLVAISEGENPRQIETRLQGFLR